jgi:hypothetical protein
MRIDALQRRLTRDVTALHTAVQDVLPVQMPDRYAEPFNLRSFLNRLNEQSLPLNVYNKLVPDVTQDKGTLRMSAEWLGYDELPEDGTHADVRILWYVNPNSRRVKVCPAEWARRRFYFYSLTMHEFIHRYQDETRDEHATAKKFSPSAPEPAIRREQEYYGDYDEIEAHAHNAALELATWYPYLNYHNAVTECLQYSGRMITPTYNMFFVAFLDNLKHPTFRTFKNKVNAWYKMIRNSSEMYDMIQLPKLATC